MCLKNLFELFALVCIPFSTFDNEYLWGIGAENSKKNEGKNTQILFWNI